MHKCMVSVKSSEIPLSRPAIRIVSTSDFIEVGGQQWDSVALISTKNIGALVS